LDLQTEEPVIDFFTDAIQNEGPTDVPIQTATKPPIPFEQLNFEVIPKDQLSRLIKVTQTVNFMKAATWREQVGLLCKILRDVNEGKRLSFRILANFFRVPNGASVEFQWHQYQKKTISLGRPTVFSSQLTEEIRKMVLIRFENKNPITIFELVDYIQISIIKK
jgi:hypothetical protein